MTLPDERTRAVIAAHEFLTRLGSPYNKNGIKKIPKAVREEALNILRHFPRPYDLHAAAQCAPDVFDAQTVMRHDEEQQPAAVAPAPPDTSWMNAEELMVDPPSGWRYGFPKIWNSVKHPDMRQWMIDNGYPEHLARQDLPVRFMSVE